MLNENIKKLRQSYNLSQVELSRALGVSKQCISNWENDNIQPSIEMLVKLADFFKVSTDSLLGLTYENFICTNGLSDKQIAHIKLIISDLLEQQVPQS